MQSIKAWNEINMEDSCTLENCSEHDVLLFGPTTFKTDQLRSQVSRHFYKPSLGKQISSSLSADRITHIYSFGKNINGKGPDGTYDQWFINGIDCEILKLGAASWQKGRVKIKLNVSLEFCPDEPEVESTPVSNGQAFSQPESPLDDIRWMIDMANA